MPEASKYGEIVTMVFDGKPVPHFAPRLQWEMFFSDLSKMIDDEVEDRADLGSEGSWLKASLLEFLATTAVTPTMKLGAQQFFRRHDQLLRENPYQKFVAGLEAICHHGYIHGPSAFEKLYDVIDTARMDVLWVRHLRGLDGDQ